jgi:hypothetical protein
MITTDSTHAREENSMTTISHRALPSVVSSALFGLGFGVFLAGAILWIDEPLSLRDFVGSVGIASAQVDGENLVDTKHDVRKRMAGDSVSCPNGMDEDDECPTCKGTGTSWDGMVERLDCGGTGH